MTDLGLNHKQRAALAALLNRLLADEFLLYAKLRKFHWNVTGPFFTTLHAFFEQQYDALEDVMDDTAELVRQFGHPALGTLAEFAQHARLKETPGVTPDARAMVAELAADHTALVRALREDIEAVDEDSDDPVTQDFLTQVMAQHQKFAWLTGALLDGWEEGGAVDAVSRTTIDGMVVPSVVVSDKPKAPRTKKAK